MDTGCDPRRDHSGLKPGLVRLRRPHLTAVGQQASARCVANTIEHTLPDEIAFLESYDKAVRGINATVDMANNLMGLLVLQVVNNAGKIPKKRRKREYEKLSDEQVERIEGVICEAFHIEAPVPEPDEPAPRLGM